MLCVSTPDPVGGNFNDFNDTEALGFFLHVGHDLLRICEFEKVTWLIPGLDRDI
jgi:hypothetical protein